MNWLVEMFSKVRFPGVKSRRTVYFTVAAVLVVWVTQSLRTNTVAEIPGTVLVMLAIITGTAALDRDPAS